MARLYQRTGKKGTVWYVDYFLDGRRIRKRLGRSKKLAGAVLAQIKQRQQRVVVMPLERYHSLLAAVGHLSDRSLAKAVAEGLSDIKAGRTVSLRSVERRLLRFGLRAE